MTRSFAATFLFLIIFLTASPASRAGELIISAASSLTLPMKEIGAIFESENPGIKLYYNFGASGMLAQQIEWGAPVDIFFSAASNLMDDLAAKNLILKETRRNILQNEMVLIAPVSGSERIRDFGDLLDPRVKKIGIGDPRIVPAGQFSQEILKNLDLWNRLQSKLVFGEEVRQVLEYVSRGEVDAGMVFLSDAQGASDRVKIVTASGPNLHHPIVYPVAMIRGATHPDSGKKWLAFAESERCRAIFEKYGFKVAR